MGIFLQVERSKYISYEKEDYEKAFNELSNENIVGFSVNYKDGDTDVNE